MADQQHKPVDDWRKLDIDALLQKLRQFLISATLKDCSVIITMQRMQPSYVPPR